MSSGKEEYRDIYNRPHHVSSKRPQMSRLNRAAQFSPFAALTGYDDLVAESARVTDEKHELGEYELEQLNSRIQYLRDHLSEEPEVSITYFQADERKAGGSYIVFTGALFCGRNSVRPPFLKRRSLLREDHSADSYIALFASSWHFHKHSR